MEFLGETENVPTMFSDSFIVCGWFTPDYAIWKDRLQSDLDRLGLEYDFTPAGSLNGSWEEKTRWKPVFMQQALHKANGKTVLYVDVDARFVGTREQVAAICEIESDIALRMSGEVRRGTRLRMHPLSGTMVLRPTQKTFRLLDEWIALKMHAQKFTTDEATLGVAMTHVPGLSVTLLHPDACARSGHPDPIILHPHRTGIRSSKFARLIGGVLPW